jgi:hypothetical protein
MVTTNRRQESVFGEWSLLGTLGRSRLMLTTFDSRSESNHLEEAGRHPGYSVFILLGDGNRQKADENCQLGGSKRELEDFSQQLRGYKRRKENSNPLFEE